MKIILGLAVIYLAILLESASSGQFSVLAKCIAEIGLTLATIGYIAHARSK